VSTRLSIGRAADEAMEARNPTEYGWLGHHPSDKTALTEKSSDSSKFETL
jgi:hypothetical protein